jgi:hypothetical protein
MKGSTEIVHHAYNELTRPLLLTLVSNFVGRVALNSALDANPCGRVISGHFKPLRQIRESGRSSTPFSLH